MFLGPAADLRQGGDQRVAGVGEGIGDGDGRSLVDGPRDQTGLGEAFRRVESIESLIPSIAGRALGSRRGRC